MLNRKGIPFEEIDVTQDPVMREKLIALTGGRTTVPQIFIEDMFVGGFDDISALEKAGKLDALLES